MILGPNGKYIPAQKVTQLYTLQQILDFGQDAEPQLVKHAIGTFWVSHFQTCPHADRFSKKQKGEST